MRSSKPPDGHGVRAGLDDHGRPHEHVRRVLPWVFDGVPSVADARRREGRLVTVGTAAVEAVEVGDGGAAAGAWDPSRPMLTHRRPRERRAILSSLRIRMSI